VADYRFVDTWPTDTGVDWWNECRTKLNVVIDAYNEWQVDGFPVERRQRVVAMIRLGLQTIGQRDGGSSYREELEGMLAFVERNTGADRHRRTGDRQ
jgi:hypothetical protein